MAARVGSVVAKNPVFSTQGQGENRGMNRCDGFRSCRGRPKSPTQLSRGSIDKTLGRRFREGLSLAPCRYLLGAMFWLSRNKLSGS